MEFIKLDKRPTIHLNKKTTNKIINFENLLKELEKRELTAEIITSINQDIKAINTFSGSDKLYLKQFRKMQSKTLKLLEKELGLVTKNHNRNLWLAIGMIVFGIPIGTAIGASLGNMAFTGIGMVIGMTVGIAIGTAKDKEASEKGNQLNIEIKN